MPGVRNYLVLSRAIRKFGSFLLGVSQITQSFDADFAILPEELGTIFGQRLELLHVEWLQLSLQGGCKAPSTIDVSWSQAVRTWRVVDHELDDVLQLTCFVRKALHDVFDHYTHDLLCFLARTLD